MNPLFELRPEQLRSRRNAKWLRYPPESLPVWVADMDFGAPPAVQAALGRLVAEQDYGYPQRGASELAERSVAEAFSRHQAALYGWAPDPDLVVAVGDLVQALAAAILAFSEPGEGVALQVPAYPPFFAAITQTGRAVVANRMVDGAAGWSVDVDTLAHAGADASILLVCSPQNPTGRAFGPDELRALGRIAVEHDLIVVCDEVHAELIYPGRDHLPMAMVSPEIAERTVTITSATKAYNLAGLRCAVMHFGSPELLARFRQRVPEALSGHVNVFGIDATIAAWEQGSSWLEAVRRQLTRNRDRLTEVLAGQDRIGYHPPEATYLAWLDLAGLGLAPSPSEFLIDRCGVVPTAGTDFGPGYEQFVRLNFGTSSAIWDEVLERLAPIFVRAG